MNKPREIILGLDPGYADTGWGVIAKHSSALEFIACGSIKTPPKQSWPQRLLLLWAELENILKIYKPTRVGIELLFFNTNQTTALKVAEARGILVALCAQRKIHQIDLTPQQIKQALTSSGRADKAQVGRMVMTLLHLKTLPKPDDAADALACAISTSFYKSTIRS